MFLLLIFLILATLVFFMDLFGYISYLLNANNIFIKLAFKNLDDERKESYKNLLLLKIIVVLFLLSFAIYFYIKQLYDFSRMLVLIASLIISFYERIVSEL
ncbi:hypothetical protein [Peptoniphilus obesi]|uniref:hypothetical protein n=1 Tax=Peptoniphilus obesi TaxID=1472765 RepID=UPI0004B05405|nr:hypothetical protein [Peptoniphilus obesi]